MTFDWSALAVGLALLIVGGLGSLAVTGRIQSFYRCLLVLGVVALIATVFAFGYAFGAQEFHHSAGMAAFAAGDQCRAAIKDALDGKAQIAPALYGALALTGLVAFASLPKLIDHTEKRGD